MVTYRAGYKLEPTCCSLGQARGRGQRIPVEDGEDGAIHGSDGPAIPPLPLPPREEQVIVPLDTNNPTQGDEKGVQETSDPIPPNGGLDTQLSRSRQATAEEYRPVYIRVGRSDSIVIQVCPHTYAISRNYYVLFP